MTRANALEDNVVLYKTVNGVRSPLDIVGRKGGYGIDIKVPADTWQHSLRVDFSGTRFRVSFNSKQLFEVEDSTFVNAGKVGLWTKADSVTLFDQINYGEANRRRRVYVSWKAEYRIAWRNASRAANQEKRTNVDVMASIGRR